MRKYKILNNTIGWVIFAVAAFTYLMTIEPTASFWDCPEFISQGFKLEVGHPPGNPIFMMAARFAINFAGGDINAVAKCVNSMSALLSAGTILLLFWTITHLVKKLVMRKKEDAEMTLSQYLVIFGSGICGALAYTWSDTFWFSAVEAEVYAFSSFCTALVFWLILKWENRADQPHSDRYLVLIAYVIGVSIAVHLLNLLCIPAIVLVFYYKKFKNTNAKGSLLALLVSFAIIFLILYGLVPGFVEVSQYFELLCVNVLGMSYNTGVLIYAIIDIAVFSWCIYELYKQNNAQRIKFAFFLSILVSGIPFIGDSWLIPIIFLIGLALYLFKYCKKIPVRIFTIIAMSIFVIFIGYSSYALILIRSSAETPMDQNSPDNVFSLESYLNREQYGERPLLYGKTFNAGVVYVDSPSGVSKPMIEEGRPLYAKVVKTNKDQPDHYKMIGHNEDYKTSPELDMFFPRMYDGTHAAEYTQWINMQGTPVQATTRVDADGNTTATDTKIKPTFVENIKFFLDYQVNYMYWRYFMWNFSGRQNDIQGMGEITQGNWISGIPAIDNMRLGDQKLMPKDLTTGNKGHNVFYMLPLLLGIIGLLWQAFSDKKGIEQFWIIFFLFFMTGLAIVIYLNQTPSQPRERDYAYAGSFYAFTIWVGMGVAGIWALIKWIAAKISEKKDKKGAVDAADSDESDKRGINIAAAVVATVIGILVPIQMVSQTWDDHDRSGRYPARDFGRNYLSSVDKNGIIFTNGDNDTFPLWYCQEVEGYRTDVRVINLSYLSTDWYIAQMQRPAYESAPVPMLANKTTFAYNERQYNYFIEADTTMHVPVLKSLEQLYGPDYKNNTYNLPQIKYPMMYIPVNADAAVNAGVITADQKAAAQEYIDCNMLRDKYTASDMAMSSSKVMSLDIIASSIAQGWKRPCYFAMTVPDSYYLGLSPYMRNTGMAYEVTPIIDPNYNGEIGTNPDKMYNIVMTKFCWAGIDKAPKGSLYLDETIRRMVTTTRSAMVDLAYDLIYQGMVAKQNKQSAAYIADRFNKARKVLQTMETKLPIESVPYAVQLGQKVAQIYNLLGEQSGNAGDKNHALQIMLEEINRYAEYIRFYQSLDTDNYRRLCSTDTFIDQQYFVSLLQTYAQLNPNGADKLMKTLQAQGINLQRFNQMALQSQQQYEAQQAAQQQAAQPQDSGSQLGGSDSSGFDGF
ncbi:MAG: DUF2723 domain-containing protein [Muribaculaceae bacterium]|jgi:hypothetical protein|nr:DUF2723 domain-containing protein [Muribaculaceae bacterium]